MAKTWQEQKTLARASHWTASFLPRRVMSEPSLAKMFGHLNTWNHYDSNGRKTTVMESDNIIKYSTELSFIGKTLTDVVKFTDGKFIKEK
jgi:hypothetical protein